MDDQLLEAWEIHNRINLYLLDAIQEAALQSKSASGGRSVGEQIAHIHNVRVMWLNSADPDQETELSKVGKEEASNADALRSALELSGRAVARLLRKSLANDGRIKGFRPHAVGFFAYLVSHESHHRGQIALTLKQAGHPLDRKVSYGLWEWGVR